MEPIVLVGGGEVHYRLIQLLKEEHVKERPIILVAQNIKVLSRNFVPYLLKMGLDAKEGQLDLWTACQRKGVYFLEDLCLKISREEKTVTLKKFGRLKYQRLSFESPSHPTCLGYELEDSPFHMLVSRPYDFMGKMREFFDEVHKHCPREVRVVFTGFNNFSIQMALTIQEKLVGGAEATDVLILEEEEEEGAGFFKSRKQKEIQKLKKTGVRVIQGAIIQNSQAHLLKLSDGTSISYDVLVPASHERAEDFLGKILQFD